MPPASTHAGGIVPAPPRSAADVCGSAQFSLFPPGALPEVATPVAEWSMEWREASLLRLVEGVRFDPERLARVSVGHPDMRDFLDHCIWQLGGRSQ